MSRRINMLPNELKEAMMMNVYTLVDGHAAFHCFEKDCHRIWKKEYV